MRCVCVGRQKHFAFLFAPGPGYRYYLFLEGYVNRVTAIALELRSIGVLFQSTCRFSPRVYFCKCDILALCWGRDGGVGWETQLSYLIVSADADVADLQMKSTFLFFSSQLAMPCLCVHFLLSIFTNGFYSCWRCLVIASRA